MKILVCEDEKSIRQFVTINLKRNGYDVVEAVDGRDALEKYDETVGVVLLDVMMPYKDGIEVCKEIRQRSKTVGIIMLTAKSQENDKVNGLFVGADDYITKPFSIKELIARVSAVARRVRVDNQDGGKSEQIETFLTSGPFELDIREHILKKNGATVDLTANEFKIIKLFMSNPSKPLTRKQILDYVWGDESFCDEKTLDVNIRRVRKKIEDDPSSPRYIQTMWSVGYVWRE